MYIVTEDGQVYSERLGRFLKQNPNTKGYPSVNLDRKTTVVHRMVAKKFIPNPLNLPQVNHKDRNKKNNHFTNLEWCTNQENCEHALGKTYKLKNRHTGEIIEVFNLNKWCKENGLHSSSMNRMISGERKYYNVWMKGE